MSKRIHFRHWGNTKKLQIPDYAMEDGINTRVARLAFAIARINRMQSIGIREDGYNLCGCTFELTFGKPCRTGGYNVEATLLIFLPNKPRRRIKED